MPGASRPGKHVSGAALIPITQGFFFGACFAARPLVIRTRAVRPCNKGYSWVTPAVVSRQGSGMPRVEPRHSLHRRGGRVFAPWFRVVFSGGSSADNNGHGLVPLLLTSENNSRLWFYDFSTDWLASIYTEWLADIGP